VTGSQKVQGFLNVSGVVASRWDEGLVFVMGGAVFVSLIALASVKPKAAPWASGTFELPIRRVIDACLISGAGGLFGVGRGIACYCPLPALASLCMVATGVLWFVAVLTGVVIAKKR